MFVFLTSYCTFFLFLFIIFSQCVYQVIQESILTYKIIHFQEAHLIFLNNTFGKKELSRKRGILNTRKHDSIHIYFYSIVSD